MMGNAQTQLCRANNSSFVSSDDVDNCTVDNLQEKSSCNRKSKNPVVSFESTSLESPNRDETQPSLFSRGGESNARAVFDVEENPHKFASSQCRRWEGSVDSTDELMFDFVSHARISEKQALDDAKSLFIEVYGQSGFNQLEKQGGFY